MGHHLHLIFFISSLLLFLGMLLGKFTYKLGVAPFLSFLLIGLLFGNGGKYDFYYDHPDLTLNISQVALYLIIFAGGLNTDFKHIKSILYPSLTLATLGVLLTTIITGLFIHLITHLSFLQACLLGAIISSTDAAAVFSILEAKSLKLKYNTTAILEVESGTNDPMVYFLVLTLIAFLQGNTFSIFSLSLSLLYNMLFGVLFGLLMGKFSVFALRAIKLKTGLNPILILTIVFFTFSLAEIIKINSFLAVYTLGIYIGNKRLNNAYIANFYEGISWMMEIILFLVLGLQVFIQDLPAVALYGVVISLFLILVARPLAVFVSLFFFKMPYRQQFYLSWVGLRGATPIVFALFPIIAGISDAKLMFNIAFFIVLTSILIQGTSVEIVARYLKITKISK